MHVSISGPHDSLSFGRLLKRSISGTYSLRPPQGALSVQVAEAVESITGLGFPGGEGQKRAGWPSTVGRIASFAQAADSSSALWRRDHGTADNEVHTSTERYGAQDGTYARS